MGRLKAGPHSPSPKGRGIKPEINGVNSPLERGARLKPGGVCKINIGLFGFGCVGKGLYDVLNHSQGLKAGITKICVKDKTKPRTIPVENFTFTKTDVLESTEHDLIVELIDDSDTALEIITNSLLKGRDVVTAGKKVVAENFELLYRLQ
ncbi:MAG: homoserine dehydrogenase, partial [Chlorobi bacterium OLB5]